MNTLPAAGTPERQSLQIEAISRIFDVLIVPLRSTDQHGAWFAPSELPMALTEGTHRNQIAYNGLQIGIWTESKMQGAMASIGTKMTQKIVKRDVEYKGNIYEISYNSQDAIEVRVQNFVVATIKKSGPFDFSYAKTLAKIQKGELFHNMMNTQGDLKQDITVTEMGVPTKLTFSIVDTQCLQEIGEITHQLTQPTVIHHTTSGVAAALGSNQPIKKYEIFDHLIDESGQSTVPALQDNAWLKQQLGSHTTLATAVSILLNKTISVRDALHKSVQGQGTSNDDIVQEAIQAASGVQYLLDILRRENIKHQMSNDYLRSIAQGHNQAMASLLNGYNNGSIEYFGVMSYFNKALGQPGGFNGLYGFDSLLKRSSSDNITFAV